MIGQRNKAIIQAFVDAINARAWEDLDALVAPTFTRHSYAAGQPQATSREDLKRFLKQECETFPDAREQIEDLLTDGDKVAVRHRFQGTQEGPLGPYPATGNVMISEYIAIYRLEGGQIVEAWAEWDNLSGLAQLGHYDPEKR